MNELTYEEAREALDCLKKYDDDHESYEYWESVVDNFIEQQKPLKIANGKYRVKKDMNCSGVNEVSKSEILSIGEVIDVYAFICFKGANIRLVRAKVSNGFRGEYHVEILIDQFNQYNFEKVE